MATYKTSGIVLRRHNLGEADRIVTFITPDRGLLRAVARGVRKTLSRQAGHIELFSEVELMLAEGRNLDIITSARLRGYPDLASDFDKLRSGYLLAQMVERLAAEDQAAPGVYSLLRQCLTGLDQRGASARLELYFKLRLLAQLGYRPQLEACANCGRLLDEVYLSAEHGGAICTVCANPGDHQLTAAQYELWQRIYGPGDYGFDQDDEAAALATAPICDTFYEYIFGRTFQAMI